MQNPGKAIGLRDHRDTLESAHLSQAKQKSCEAASPAV